MTLSLKKSPLKNRKKAKLKVTEPLQTAQIRLTKTSLERLDNLASDCAGETVAERRGVALLSFLTQGSADGVVVELNEKLTNAISTLQGTTESLLKVSAEKKALQAQNEMLKGTIQEANKDIQEASDVADSRNAVIKGYQSTLESMIVVMKELTS